MNQRGLAIAAVVGTGVQVGAAIVATRREVGAEQGRKRFFFEKKKQKTFYPFGITGHWPVWCAKQWGLASPVLPGTP